jgi:hypothetical protein
MDGNRVTAKIGSWRELTLNQRKQFNPAGRGGNRRRRGGEDR